MTNSLRKLGLDIGYSNLKFIYGNGEDSPTQVLMPAVAAPLSSLPVSYNLTPQTQTVVLVDGEDEPWVVGDEGTKNYTGHLFRAYLLSTEYQALYHAALAHTRATQFEHVVTGLPVSQMQPPTDAKRLVGFMSGRHRLAEGLEVQVHKVTVVAQPFGSFMTFFSASRERFALIKKACVLIIDAGYYSLDWATFNQGRMDDSASGTSLLAVSVISEQIAQYVRNRYGLIAHTSVIVDALRAQDHALFLRGQSVPITEVLASAAAKVSAEALRELQQSLRRLNREPNLILVTGGGAALYRAPIEATFAPVPVGTLEDPVMANAKGFYLYD